jgi:hypothetical protein
MSADRCTCASHGPWVAIRDRRRMCPWRVEAEDGRAYVADIPQPTRDPYPIFEANAQHIATFDPPTVLSLLSRLREAEEALRLASGVVDSQVSTERYLERQAIQAGHYTPDPNDTHKSAAVKAQDAILASLRYDPTEREDEGSIRQSVVDGDPIPAITEAEPSAAERRLTAATCTFAEHIDRDGVGWSKMRHDDVCAILGEVERLRAATAQPSAAARHLFRRDDEDPAEYQKLIDEARARHDAEIAAEKER